MPNRRSIIEASCALAVGLLLAAALPPFSRSPLAWLALVPLLAVRRWLSSRRCAVLAAVAATLPVWTVGSLLGLRAIPIAYGIAAIFTVSAALGGAAACGLVVERRLRSPLAPALVYPAVAVAIEGITRAILPDLAVPSLAWSQRPGSLLIQSGLAVASPLPVTFLIVLTNVGLADGLAWLRAPRGHTTERSPFPAATVLTVVLFVANLVFGIARASETEPVADAVHLQKGTRP